jgi:hypothetical protein
MEKIKKNNNPDELRFIDATYVFSKINDKTIDCKEAAIFISGFFKAMNDIQKHTQSGFFLNENLLLLCFNLKNK